jgi:diguanylate cyclase (GGDEF)-like protein
MPDRIPEDLFRAVLRAAPQPSVVVDRFSKAIVDGSDTFLREFMRRPRWTLFDAVDFTHPERVEALIARGSGTVWNAVYRRGGVMRVANIRCYSADYEGASYAYLLLDDVTEQNYLKAAFDAIPDPLLILSSQRTLLYANHPAEQLFGDLYFGASMTPMLPPGTLDAGRRVEIRGQLYVTGNLPFRFAGETESSMILTLRNVSEETELLRLATHDALTGVYNTRYFDDVLQKEPEGCLAIVDVDYFKPINDELGHAAGDAALILFTNLIRAELRPTDVLARLGGDEFAIYFPCLPLDEATSFLDAIYRRLARSPFRYDGATRTFSASAGITVARQGDTALALRKRADEALYEAKRQGRGRWVVSKDEGMTDEG